MTTLWQCTFPVNPVEAMQYADAFDEWAVASSWHEVDKSSTWQFEAIFQEKPNAEKLKSTLPGIEYSLETLPDTNWLQASYAEFPSLHIERYYIYGSHITDLVPEGMFGIQIDAATAFGSGQHETTEGCLRAFHTLSQSYSFENPLDMGCGSGILTMAIARTWEVPVLACDNDPEAVRVTQENATINDLAPYISAEISEGFASPVIQNRAPFDLIVANILAGPLCLMAQDACKTLQTGGIIVLSGILNTQAEQVIAAYRLGGCTLLEHTKIGDWTTLIMRQQG